MKPRHFALFLATGLVTVVLGGCASTRTDLVEAGIIAVDIVDTKPTRVTRVSVLGVDGDTVLTGIVARQHNRSIWLRGHVDLTVTDSSGEILVSQPIRFHRRRLTRHVWEGHFTYRFEYVLPPGTSMTLKHHDGRHSTGMPADISSSAQTRVYNHG